MLRRLCVVAFLLCGVGAACAATLNVGPAGSGAAYTKIQDAINAANPGDTVVVAPGTYYENIDFKGKAITVTSSGGAASTVIDGGSVAAAVTFKSAETKNAILSGFTVQHGGNPNETYSEPSPIAGIYISDGSPTILNNIITQNMCWDVYTTDAAPLIQGNEISATLSPQGGCGFGSGAGIYVGENLQGSFPTSGNGTPPTIIGNTIENNVDSGFSDAGGNGGAGIAVWGGSPIIESNIIRNNSSPGGTGGAINVTYGTGITVLQNLIYGNSAGCGGGALSFWGGGLGGGYYILVANNTIVDNVGQSNAGYSDCIGISQIYPFPGAYGESGPTAVFVNNIIAGSTSDPAIDCSQLRLGESPLETQQPIFDHNLLYNSNGAFFGVDCVDVSAKYGNVVGDPGFINKAAGNYQLKPGSPAIDAGNNSALQIMQLMGATPLSKDLNGSARLQDATGKGYPVIDIGAYEFGGVTETSPTTEVLSSSPYDGPAGPNYTLTATLSSSLGVPTGSTTFYLDEASLGTSIITNGVATLSNVNIAPGIHNVYATYPGQGLFTPAISVIIIIDVSLYSTNLTITGSPNPSIVGQSVTFSIHASSFDPNFVPSPITLMDGNTQLATLTPDSSGNATFQTSALTLGPHYIVASYAGDSQHAAMSASVDQDVLSGYPTTTAISAVPNPVIQGQSVMLTAKVTTTATGQGVPQGTVSFTYGSVALGTGTLDATGSVSVLTSSLPLGNDTITATYTPSSTFMTSSGTMVEQVISGYPTSTTLTSTLNPASPVQSVTFTAKVAAQTASSGTPTGSIVFKDGTNTVATVPLASGVTTATWMPSSLTAGVHDVVATFVPTGSFAASNAELLETVGWATVTTTSVTPEPSTYGQPVVFSVHVAGVAGSVGTPTGQVLVMFCHGAQSPLLTLDSSGNASYVAPPAGGISDPAGSCPYTAQYLGDGTFLPSTSVSTPYIVNPASSQTTITSASPNPGFLGQSVTLTATVAGTPSPSQGPGGVILQPGSTVATGTVQFYDGATALGAPVALSAAQTASLMTSLLALGPHTITAKYSGDTNLQGSTSTGVVEVIQQIMTSTALIVVPNPGAQNEPVTMGVTVAALGGVGAPFGTVTITDGGVVLTTLPISSGSGTSSSVSFTTSSLAVGTHPLQAVFTPGCAAVICQFTPYVGSQSAVVSEVIQPQDFSVSADPPSISIQTKHHASLTLTVTPVGQFSGPVTLACVGVVPKWSSCRFSSAVVQLNGTAAVSTTLTIDTDQIEDFASNRGVAWLAVMLPLALAGLRKRRRVVVLGLIVAASVAVISMSACSGHQPANVEPGTYTLTVQGQGTAIGATSPTVHTVGIALEVTP